MGFGVHSLRLLSQTFQLEADQLDKKPLFFCSNTWITCYYITTRLVGSFSVTQLLFRYFQNTVQAHAECIVTQLILIQKDIRKFLFFHIRTAVLQFHISVSSWEQIALNPCKTRYGEWNTANPWIMTLFMTLADYVATACVQQPYMLLTSEEILLNITYRDARVMSLSVS